MLHVLAIRAKNILHHLYSSENNLKTVKNHLLASESVISKRKMTYIPPHEEKFTLMSHTCVYNCLNDA